MQGSTERCIRNKDLEERVAKRFLSKKKGNSTENEEKTADSPFMDTTKQRKALPLRKTLYGLIRMLLEYVSRSHTGRFEFCYGACLRYIPCIVAETRSGPLRCPSSETAGIPCPA